METRLAESQYPVYLQWTLGRTELFKAADKVRTCFEDFVWSKLVPDRASSVKRNGLKLLCMLGLEEGFDHPILVSKC